jgi:tetratricopeptide (TPR) repeat protein
MLTYDFDLYSRWKIEASIRQSEQNLSAGLRAARENSDANDRKNREFQEDSKKRQKKLKSRVVELRSDMLQGLGKISGQITEQGEAFGRNMVRIEAHQLITLQALRDHKTTLSILSENLVKGFNQVFQSQSKIESSLAKIEADIQVLLTQVREIQERTRDAETTQALARYERAIKALLVGQLTDAMALVDAAIENDGKTKMNDLPQISFLRGCFYLGVFDDEKNAWLDPERALYDFKKAESYEKNPDDVRRIRSKLAYSYFLAKNYEAAESLYADLEHEGGILVSFDRGRCLLGMSDFYGASQLFEEMFRHDPTLALLPAADPFCHNYSQFFHELNSLMKRADQEQQELQANLLSQHQALRGVAQAAFQDTPQLALKATMDCVERAISACQDCKAELAEVDRKYRQSFPDDSLTRNISPENIEQLRSLYEVESVNVALIVSNSGLRPWYPIGDLKFFSAQIMHGIEEMDRAAASAEKLMKALLHSLTYTNNYFTPVILMPSLKNKFKPTFDRGRSDELMQSLQIKFHNSLGARHKDRIFNEARKVNIELGRIKSFRVEMSRLRLILNAQVS